MAISRPFWMSDLHDDQRSLNVRVNEVEITSTEIFDVVALLPLVHTIRKAFTVKGTILIERPRSIIKIWSNYCSNDLNFVIWPVNDLKNRLNLTNIVMSLITNLISLLLTSRKCYVMLYTVLIERLRMEITQKKIVSNKEIIARSQNFIPYFSS